MVSSGLSCVLVECVHIDDLCEIVCLDILPSASLQLQQPLRVIAVYRTPGATRAVRAAGERMIASLRSLFRPDSRAHILAGDFNFPHIDWRSLAAIHSLDRSFINFTTTFSLSQLVHKPTMARRPGQTPHILDLILTDKVDLFSHISIGSRVALCDHLPVIASLSIRQTPRSSLSPRFDYAKADWPAINSRIASIDWTLTFAGRTLAECCSLFQDCVASCQLDFIPLKPQRSNSQKAPAYIQRLSAKATRLAARRPYSRDTKRAQKDLRRALYAWNTKLESSLLSKGQRKFFHHVRSRLNPADGIGPISCADGVYIHDESEKAEAFSEYFDSVYSNLPIPSGAPLTDSSHSINQFHITHILIAKTIRSLAPKINTSPDGITHIFLKHTIDSVVTPIFLLFQQSLSACVVPPIWRIGYVRPIHKGGSQSEVVNYRPIALTATLSKLLERICAAQMTEHFEKHCLLTSRQFGFRAGRSTCAQLVECHAQWSRDLTDGQVVDCLYVDYKKAFDCINHSMLFKKLHSLGVRGSALAWIKSFLCDRTTRVLVSQCLSSPRTVNCGVPQGSCLGPLLFNVFINNIVDCLPDYVRCALYADDLKVSYAFSPLDLTARTMFQRAVDCVSEWSIEWGLTISASKTQVLHLGKRNPLYAYSLGTVSLESPECVKDLGVYISTRLSFDDYIKRIVDRTLWGINDFLRAYRTRSLAVLCKAFVTYYRCKLEYCTELWNPSDVRSVNLIEGVQRYFTRRICHRNGIFNLGYSARLCLLGLETLESRRAVNDIAYIHKIVHGRTVFDSSAIYNIISTSSRHSHCHRIVPSFDPSVRTQTFIHRKFRIWNSLPSNIIAIRDTGSFKEEVRKCMIEPSRIRAS